MTKVTPENGLEIGFKIYGWRLWLRNNFLLFFLGLQ
jgi:hypothetical protein